MTGHDTVDVRDVLRGFLWPEASTDIVQLLELEQRDGAGVRVALLDGGACLSDPDLQGAAIEVVDFAGGHPDSAEDERHGTRDLMLLVAQGRSRVRGLVPAASVLFGRVLRGDGGEPRSLTEAIRWSVREGARIVAMPLGMAMPDDGVAAAIEEALAAGVRLFAAAGNDYPRPIEFPAQIPGVIAVGAADERGELLPSCCRTPRLDVVAPGVEVPGIGRPGNGTSLACVLVAGLEALRLGSPCFRSA